MHPKHTVIQGIISVNSRGVGFLSEPDAKTKKGVDDIEIPPEDLRCAFHGDEVEVEVMGKAKKVQPPRGRLNLARPIGRVVRIVKRKKESFVGVVTKDGETLFIRPDDWRCYTDFRIAAIPRTDLGRKRSVLAQEGDKVLFKMLPWTEPARAPEAEIVEVIGRAGEHNTEMRALALARGFSSSFPPAVEREAEEWKRRAVEAFANEIPTRRDFRAATTFTIDPVDAKDFDDALSLREITKHLASPDLSQRDKDQNTKVYEVGVHIADVSFFVREGTALDTEARERGFSVYLVDRTIPMLPEALSNDLCSLNPDEDKLAFSAVFEINEKAEVLARWFGRTVIRSAKRFTYEEAQEVLDIPRTDLGSGKRSVLKDALDVLNRLAKIMDERNRREGAIDFATDEVKFELDANGRPLRIYKKPHLETHKLVEEWMLLANREVAQFLNHAREKKPKKEPVLYRIHDVPDEEKIAELALFVKALGHHLPLWGKGVTGKDLQQLFKKIEGSAEEALIKTTALRSMAKAIYSTKNIGHFGLAMPFYTHFTSPIRRYADLMVHRMLAAHLHGEKMPAEEWGAYEKLADHITEKEIAAAEAERESVKMKKVEYMAERVGQSFEGTISGITEWGIYIEENDTKSEGMAALRNFQDDFYSLNEKQYAIVGSRTGKKYTLGDTVHFTVVGADPERKTLDYQVIR